MGVIYVRHYAVGRCGHRPLMMLGPSCVVLSRAALAHERVEPIMMIMGSSLHRDHRPGENDMVDDV